MRTENEGADGLVPGGRHTSSSSSVVMTSSRSRWSTKNAFAVRYGVTNYDLLGYVHPELRRRGIGKYPLRTQCRSASPTGSLDRGPGSARSWSGAHAEESEMGHRTLLERRGLRPDPPLLPDASPGSPSNAPHPIHPTAWKGPTLGADDHWVGTGMLEDEAFRDHWGAHAHTEHEFQVTDGLFELDTDLWVVAWDGDQVAGVVQT